MLIFGGGYLGIRVARHSVFAGHTVWVTTRSPQRVREIEASGAQPVICDWTNPMSLRQLPRADHLLVSVSYDRKSRHSRYDSQVGGLRNLLKHTAADSKICYISTTGVYHQSDGRWVDERSPSFPTRAAGRTHLQAEDLLRRYRNHGGWNVLRLAGIYGPGRIPRADNVISSLPIHANADHFVNLIHVDDAVTAVAATWSETPHHVYVVGDGHPVRRGEFYGEIARLTQSAPPEFLPPTPGQSRADGHKRVWNRRAKRDLIPRLQFPSYREGLASLFAQ